MKDIELEWLARDLESDRVERNESLSGSGAVKIREAVCAFANDLPGHGLPGVVIVGLRDDGWPVGNFEVTDRMLLDLAGIKTDGNVVPPPSILVEKRTILGSECAIVTVLPCDTPPVRYQGRIHVRWGPRRGLASAQDERILNERRRLADHPFDVRGLRGATLAELDLTRFQLEYLPALVAPDILEANDRTLEQKLCATKMVVSEENPTPTVLGMLMVGKAPADWLPGAYTQFLRLNGTSLADAALSNLVVDDAVIRGRLPEQIERLEAKLESHNRKAVRFADVPTEVRQEDYPLEALQQLVRNAYLHRSYEATNSPTRVYWYDDRIEIWSPGGPCGTVTAANFGSPGLTDYRNPNLAEALRAMGFVQRFGAGLTLARRLLGDRLQFEVDAGFVRVIVAARRG